MLIFLIKYCGLGSQALPKSRGSNAYSVVLKQLIRIRDHIFPQVSC